jgi:hypothetical protein
MSRNGWVGEHVHIEAAQKREASQATATVLLHAGILQHGQVLGMGNGKWGGFTLWLQHKSWVCGGRAGTSRGRGLHEYEREYKGAT